ncbi:MAG TPA: hypothetical protein VN193_11885 [Candidatus Angelobacter sp.]|nr:hypothetical protein [Candidatus Angelobacter sp.]
MQDQGGYKTIGVRLDMEVHAQLTALARIEGGTLTAEIEAAIAEYLERKRTDPATAAKAEALLAEFDRNTQAQRDAIAGLFGGMTEGTTVPLPSSRRTPKSE